MNLRTRERYKYSFAYSTVNESEETWYSPQWSTYGTEFLLRVDSSTNRDHTADG